MKFFRITLWVQALYYFLTSIWPLLDIKSFMEITGPKTNIWLVKTMAVLLIAISFSFLANLFIKTNPWPVIVLAVSCCVFLAFIDFYFVSNKTISWVYLFDAVLQIILLLAWIVIIIRMKKQYKS